MRAPLGVFVLKVHAVTPKVVSTAERAGLERRGAGRHAGPCTGHRTVPCDRRDL